MSIPLTVYAVCLGIRYSRVKMSSYLRSSEQMTTSMLLAVVNDNCETVSLRTWSPITAEAIGFGSFDARCKKHMKFRRARVYVERLESIDGETVRTYLIRVSCR